MKNYRITIRVTEEQNTVLTKMCEEGKYFNVSMMLMKWADEMIEKETNGYEHT